MKKLLILITICCSIYYSCSDAKAKEVKPTIEQFRNDGLTYSKIADKLNETNVPTARGGKWYASTVRRYYKREV